MASAHLAGDTLCSDYSQDKLISIQNSLNSLKNAGVTAATYY